MTGGAVVSGDAFEPSPGILRLRENDIRRVVEIITAPSILHCPALDVAANAQLHALEDLALNAEHLLPRKDAAIVRPQALAGNFFLNRQYLCTRRQTIELFDSLRRRLGVNGSSDQKTTNNRGVKAPLFSPCC